MQIQLKQPELEQAIHQYLTNSGLDLRGKNLAVKFATTRKPFGIAADVTIEDTGSLRAPTAVKPQPLRVAKSEDAPEPVKVEDPQEAVPADDDKQEEAPVTRTSSLFAG